jgi:outer membrane lipoprotein-sorting protein
MTFVSLAVVVLAGSTAEDQGAALSRELWQRNAGYRDMSAEVEMTLTDADGSEARRSFSLKVLERPSQDDGERSLIVFEAPADVKGTAVLSHGSPSGDDEQWLFVPSARRTRRISSSNRTGAFVGSEFTFEDLTGNDGRKYTWKALGEKACEGGKCVQLEATPKEASSSYSRRVLMLDANDYRIRSIAFFDRKGELLKTLVYDDYQKLNEKFLRAQRWTMTNAQTAKKTTIRFTAMKLATGLSVTDFVAAKLGN